MGLLVMGLQSLVVTASFDSLAPYIYVALVS